MRTIIIIFLTFIIQNSSIAQGKIFFDSNWDECSKKEAVYYRKLTKTLDNQYEVEDFFMNGNIQMTATFSDPEILIKEGVCIWYYKNGNKKTEANYKHNKVEGIKKSWSIYHDSVEYIPYQNGKLNGVLITCNKQGDTLEHIEYLDGKLEGKVLNFYPDGALYMEAYFKNDLEIGKWTFWKENKQKDYEINYKEGEFHGLLTIYGDDGKINTSVLYDSGIGIMNTYHRDENKNVVYEFKQTLDEKTGIFYKFFPDSKMVKFKYDILNGIAHGNFESYFKNGKIESSGSVLLGYSKGEWKMYNSNGELIDTVIFNESNKIPVGE